MKIINHRARHDFQILDTIECGVKLTGAEVKSVKGGKMSLEGSFVKILGNEVYLVNAQIYPYSYARPEGYDPKRTRKLLLHKREILSLRQKMNAGRLTIIPVECYNTHGLVKLKIALAKGAKEYEKREKLRKKDMQRDVERELRGKS